MHDPHDRYRIETTLASGGMCEVLRARDTRLDRTVSLKRLHPHLHAQPDVVAMWLHEAAVLAQLAHPCLPALYDVLGAGASSVVVMEYVAGGTLAGRIARTGALGVRESVRVVTALLAGLAYVHAARDADGVLLELIHRDISSANVMVRDDGVVKLVDFGIASSRWRAQPDGDGGTMGYLAPERIAEGSRGDAQGDVYGAGVVLYECLVGHRPFAGDLLAVMHATVNDAVPATHTGHAALDAVVARATARDRSVRFASAGAFAEALASAVTASGVAA